MPRKPDEIEHQIAQLKGFHNVTATNTLGDKHYDLIKLVGLLRDIEMARLAEELERAKK